VIIINYNGGEFVVNCANSVLKSSYPSIEILIVDNSSTDESLRNIEREFREDKRVTIIKNSRNTGYAAAINLAAKIAKGDYLAILNNDTTPDADWLNRPLELMEADHSIGTVQPTLFYYDKPAVLNDAGHFIDRFGVVYSRDSISPGQSSPDNEDEIFAATGAAMIVRREAFENVGGFDSDFFLLFEETDFCWRIWLSGQRVVLVPRSKVYHRARAAYRLTQETSYLFNRNRICSMLKNYDIKYVVRFVPSNFLIILGTGLYMLGKSRPAVILENVKAILWNLANLRSTLLKREKVRKIMKVPQTRLFSSGLIRPSNLPVLLGRLQEQR
jgi:GT2 family glycosyltransferase